MMATIEKELTAAHVMDMFMGLRLPVTDDGDQIAGKARELRDFYLRMSRSTEPHKRAEAKLWFKNLTRLEQDRPALLGVVRDAFDQSSDTALEAALSSGLRKLTPKLHAQLEGLALGQYKSDPPLARRFVEDYLRERGLQVDATLVFPHLVEKLEAVSAVGRIDLSWRLPAEHCDEVVLRRFTAKGSGRELERGRLSGYTDRKVAAGQRYRYEVSSVSRAEESRTGVAIEVLAVGEVSEVGGFWVRDHVELRWQRPAAGCEVFVFRAPSSLAPLAGGAPEPLPEHPQAELVYRGKASSCEDRQAAEGREYSYLILAFFAPGHFSPGVVLPLRTPVPPPAVSAVSAEYAEETVWIRWSPVVRPQRLEYVVVRRDGGVPAARIEDGHQVAVTRETICSDPDVVPGRRYAYAVFTQTGEIASRSGTAAPPVDVLAEVKGLAQTAGDSTVELDWESPQGAGRVIVRRAESLPEGPGDGSPVSSTGPGHAKDEGLTNGRRYHYLVCCVYRAADGCELVSPGVRISAVPERLPEPVEELELRARASEVHGSWEAPEHGQVVVLRSVRPHGLAPGTRLGVAEMERLGERVVSEAARIRDAAPDARKPYYSLFTVAGEQAVAGGAGACVAAADVTGLRLTASRDGVVLRWAWPRGLTAASVARRAGTWPQGPDDPRARHVLCLRTDYAAAGEKLVDPIAEERGRFCYVVYARAAAPAEGANGGGKAFYAPGADPGCRAVIQWEPWMTLHYRATGPAREHGKGPELELTWSCASPFPDFAGFVLVASRDKVPSSPSDGVELFRWAPRKDASETVAGEHRTSVSLAPIRDRRWERFFFKAMVLDPAQGPSTLIVHPDVTIPVSATGEVLRRRSGKPGRYPTGVPKKVICPHCFEEFPPGRMRFAPFGGGPSRPARYGWLGRLLRRPPQPPVDERGRRLTRKVCPQGHDLPFTAGAQASLVLGLIGAKLSGKSHYVASLVQRLGGQVGRDLDAALLPVTDETQLRYQREFYDPLFKNSLELPMTVGAPPPLVYDLSFDGQLWGEKRQRRVTLALFDTAGENFRDGDRVRQMVQYLRVASGVVFLIDPLQSQVVRDALPASAPVPEADQMADANAIVSRVLTKLEDGKVVREAGQLPTPVAVVLTKCDLLREAGLIESNRLWASEARHVGFFDRELHDDTSGMIGEFLERIHPTAYRNVQQRFPHHAFFGVSATGCASDEVTRRYRFVSPWRVEDPLLWLLAELGVIPDRER